MLAEWKLRRVSQCRPIRIGIESVKFVSLLRLQLFVWQCYPTAVWAARARIAASPRAPTLSHCFLFSRLSGSALEMLSGALGPALRRALAPQLVSLLRLQQLIWQCSRNALWGARARLAAGPRAPTLSTASSSTICMAVLLKCCPGRSGLAD